MEQWVYSSGYNFGIYIRIVKRWFFCAHIKLLLGEGVG